MNRLVIAALLGGLIYALLHLRRPYQRALGADGTVRRSVFPAPESIYGWPREVAVFLASLSLAYIVTDRLIGWWFHLSTALAAPLGISPGVMSIALLAGLGYLAHRFGWISKLRQATANQVPSGAPPLSSIETEATSTWPDTADSSDHPEPALPTAPAFPMAQTSQAPEIETQDNRAKSPWLKVGVAAALAVLVLFGAASLNPTAFNAVKQWAGLPTLPSSDTFSDATISTEPPLDNGTEAAESDQTQQIAIDQVLEDFVRSARVARSSRETIATELNPALAQAQAQTDTPTADRIRASIAAKEQALADARQTARDALSTIAEAITTDPEIVDQAIGIVRALPGVREDVKAGELLSQLMPNKGLASQPENFIQTLMAAWERTIMVAETTQLDVASEIMTPPGRPRDITSSANVRLQPLNGGRPQNRSSIGPQRREHIPGMQIPADEFQ